MPETSRVKQSHHTGLKAKSIENAMSAPVTPPMAAVWVEIFHHTLTMAHTIWMSSAAMRMRAIKLGMRSRVMR